MAHSTIILKINENQTFLYSIIDCIWNVMAQAQKPDFVFRQNGRVHLNRRGASVQSTTGNRVVRISGSNAGYTMFRGSVKSTGYPLHSPVSPSLPLPCVTVCHHISTELYLWNKKPYYSCRFLANTKQSGALRSDQVSVDELTRLITSDYVGA